MRRSRLLRANSPTPSSLVATAFFTAGECNLPNLTVRHAIPAAFSQREYTDVGGLMSYGSKIADVYRQVGAYAGRISKAPSPRTCRLCSRPSSS